MWQTDRWLENEYFRWQLCYVDARTVPACVRKKKERKTFAHIFKSIPIPLPLS